jgi:hypothetical protein
VTLHDTRSINILGLGWSFGGLCRWSLGTDSTLHALHSLLHSVCLPILVPQSVMHGLEYIVLFKYFTSHSSLGIADVSMPVPITRNLRNVFTRPSLIFYNCNEHFSSPLFPNPLTGIDKPMRLKTADQSRTKRIPIADSLGSTPAFGSPVHHHHHHPKMSPTRPHSRIHTHTNSPKWTTHLSSMSP